MSEETLPSEIPDLFRYGLLQKKLESEGFKIEYCGGFAPTQIGGYMPGGEYFYYRARGEQVSLEVWTENLEPREEHLGWCPASKPAFFALRRPFDWPEAGFLPITKGEKWLRRLFRMFKEWKKNPASLPRIKRSWSMKKHERMMRRLRKKEARTKKHG